MNRRFEIESHATEPEQRISADNAYADALQAGEDCMDAFAESEA